MKVNNTRSIFDAPRLEDITKADFLKFLKSIVKSGGEISWFTTDKQSFDWSDINENVKRFLLKIESLEFKTVGIAVFYPKTKQMQYHSFAIAKSIK
ncbi:MAG: hypothetical protein KGL95_07805 [Patescibacteria group bacterium]|nr:hypothetical protein [Patescibacteria group bacterium]